MSHIPVLLEETLAGLALAPGKFIVDGTIDGGGHAREIVKRISPGGRLLGIDWDQSMVARLPDLFRGHAATTLFVHGNYADLSEMLVRHRLPQADGLLLDLGFSSAQLESSGRGFSFLADEPLRMTYDDTARPAAEVLSGMSEREIANMLFTLGGERYARRIALAIVTARRKSPIRTAGTLAAIVRSAVPKNYERGRIDPATRTFQALRITVNRELENLEQILDALPKVLAPRGRAAIITFHSLEDRIVKQKFRLLEKNGELKILTKKPVPAALAEIKQNPRSRSAKLRIAEIN